MSKYTAELREIISTFSEEEVISWFCDYELEDYLTQEQIDTINAKGTWSKEKLARKIVNHYFISEIGFESASLFKLRAKAFMEETMEEYLPLIYSSAIKYDPLVNVDFSETFKRNTNSKSSSNSTSAANGSGLSVESDTPQGQINKQDILDGKYASRTTANSTDNTINDNSTSNSDGFENYTKTTRGNSGISTTAQKLIEQYRNTIRAYDREIIEKAGVLFMGIM